MFYEGQSSDQKIFVSTLFLRARLLNNVRTSIISPFSKRMSILGCLSRSNTCRSEGPNGRRSVPRSGNIGESTTSNRRSTRAPSRIGGGRRGLLRRGHSVPVESPLPPSTLDDRRSWVSTTLYPWGGLSSCDRHGGDEGIGKDETRNGVRTPLP